MGVFSCPPPPLPPRPPPRPRFCRPRAPVWTPGWAAGGGCRGCGGGARAGAGARWSAEVKKRSPPCVRLCVLRGAGAPLPGGAVGRGRGRGGEGRKDPGSAGRGRRRDAGGRAGARGGRAGARFPRVAPRVPKTYHVCAGEGRTRGSKINCVCMRALISNPWGYKRRGLCTGTSVGRRLRSSGRRGDRLCGGWGRHVGLRPTTRHAGF